MMYWTFVSVVVIFFLNQQFVTRRAEADRGSYFVTTYKRNRSTRGQKLNRKREKKEIKERTNRTGKEKSRKEKKKRYNQVQLGENYINCLQMQKQED